MSRLVAQTDASTGKGKAAGPIFPTYPRECADAVLKRLEAHIDPPGAKFQDHNGRRRRRFCPIPSIEPLRELLDVAHAASLQPEESRFASFALAFVKPNFRAKNYTVVRFRKPRPFTPAQIAKLAPATDPNRTFLGIAPSRGSLGIWGLISSNRGPRSKEVEGGESAFAWPHEFLLVRARGPGILYVYYETRLCLQYVRGTAYFDMEAGHLQTTLRARAALDGIDANQIAQIVSRMVLLGRGGALVITDPAKPVRPRLMDLSYKFDPPSRMLRDAVDAERAWHDGTVPKKQGHDLSVPVTLALDRIARLTQVDGVVHLSSDLVVHGFGAKIQTSTRQRFTIIEETPGRARKRRLPFASIPGMRHRSAAAFCHQQPGQALAIVVSQDGDVSLFGRQPDGEVRKIGPFALGAAIAIE